MASQWWSDDDRLAAVLGDAIRAARAVPREFVESGKAEYTWRSIDAELLVLTYDSAFDEAGTPAARARHACLRFLTFASAELTIELEIISDAVLGQIMPPRPGHMEGRSVSGDAVISPIDEAGCFVMRPIPSSPFRLHCQTEDGVNVLTSWISL
jgi:hypothetical protein